MSLLNWADKKNSPNLADFISKYGAEYCMTAEEINEMRDAVNEMGEIQKTTFLGVAEPADTPNGTGRGYWEVITPGTYTNFGGVVLATDQRGLIARDAEGSFKISKVGFNLFNYILKDEAYNNFKNLYKSNVFEGSGINTEVFNFLLDIEFTGLKTNPTDKVHIYNVFRAYPNPSTPRWVLDIAINGVRFVQWGEDNYVEPTADSKGNIYDVLVLTEMNGSGITGKAQVNWAALTNGSVKQFDLPSEWVYGLLSQKKHLPSLTDNYRKEYDNQIIRLDNTKVFAGKYIEPYLNNFILDILIDSTNFIDTDKVHLYNIWRAYPNPTTPRWVIDIAVNGVRFSQFLTDNYIEPTADSKGNIFDTITLIPFSGSGITTKLKVNWAVIPIGFQKIYISEADRSKTLISKKKYLPALPLSASDVGKGVLTIDSYLNKIEKNNVFSGDTIDSKLLDFVLNIKFTGILVSKPVNGLIYVSNLRRAHDAAGFIRHLVRISINNVEVCNWFKDSYVEPATDVNGHIYDTILLTASQTTGVYAGITATLKVDWSVLAINSSTIFEGSDENRKKGLISPNVYNQSTAGAKTILPSITIPHRIYTTLNDVDIRNIVPVPAGYLRQDLVRNYALSLYVDRFLIGFPINTSVRFSNSTDKFRVASRRKNDDDNTTEHPTPSQIVSKSAIISGGNDYADKTITFNNVSTRETTGVNSIVNLLAIGDSTIVGLNAELGVPQVGYANKCFGVVHEQFIKCKIDFLLSQGYSVSVIQEYLDTNTSSTITTPHQNSYLYRNIGTGANISEGVENYTLSYRGLLKSYTLKSEGRGGWAYYHYINKPRNFARAQGLYDILGLGNGTGTDYTGTAAQMLAIDRTAWNSNNIIDTPAMRAYFTALGFTGTDLASYKTYAQSVANDPQNYFYDDSKTTTITDSSGNVWQVKFSISKYLERYRTTTNAGVRLGSSDPSKGSKVSDVNAYDVFLPSHIIIQSCQNDGNVAHFGLMAKTLSTAIKDEYTSNGWGFINIGLSIIDGVGTYFPNLYPEVGGNVTMNEGQRSVHNDNLGRLLLNVTNEDTNKIWTICNTHVTPTAKGLMYRNSSSPEFDLSGIEDDRYLIPSRTATGLAGHPNGYGHRVWGIQFFSWVKYTLGL